LAKNNYKTNSERHLRDYQQSIYKLWQARDLRYTLQP